MWELWKGGSPRKGPRCPARDMRCTFCGIRGHYKSSCQKATQAQSSSDSQTAKTSTVIGYHPSVDAVHHDRRIRFSVSFLQICPNISLQQRRQGPQELRADTGAEVTALTEGVFQKHFSDDVIQTSTKIFKGFNGARQPATNQVSEESSFQGGQKLPNPAIHSTE